MDISAALALLSAAVWGAGDFLGGLSTRALANTYTTIFVSQLTGLVLIGFAAPFISGTPLLADLAWGVAAGAAGVTGLFFLYRGLAQGQMNVVAPVTAVTAAVVPVAVGLALGETPKWTALVGVAVAFVAIALLGMQAHPDDAGESAPSGRILKGAHLRGALLAGIGFGIFFVGIAQTSEEAGLWPLVAARGVGVVGFGLIPATWAGLRAIRQGRKEGASNLGVRFAMGSGVLDISANIAYLTAVRAGSLTLIPVLSSLYPASTVILARVFLHERIGRLHLLGIGVALVAIVLIVGSA